MQELKESLGRDDYLKWANDYKQQADSLTQKIEKAEKQRHLRFKNVKDREKNERYLKMLYDMRNEALYAMKCLLKYAKSMEENNE